MIGIVFVAVTLMKSMRGRQITLVVVMVMVAGEADS